MSYGRLHATNDGAHILWRGEKCRTWHQVYDVLRYMDGLSSQEATYQMRIKNELPKVAQSYREKIFNGHGEDGEWVLRLHVEIWSLYVKRLFELFDLRHPDLWEKYRQFLKEVYDLKGCSPNIIPPLDNVC